jgi:threonine-phosphate decarboxylase
MPWNVNSLAIEAGKYILENEEDLLPDVPTILNQSLELQAKLAQNEMLEVIPSSCNYFLVKLKKGKAASLKEYLLREYGFLIRDACNFRGLNDHYFRIAVQHSSENRKLYNAINSWLKIQ